MKAVEWREKFLKCSTFDELTGIIDEYIEETINLGNLRKNSSAVTEQRQKWRAIQLFQDVIFDASLDLCCPELSQIHYKNPVDLILIELIKDINKKGLKITK